MRSLAALFSLAFISFSLYYEHFKHDIPSATLMIGWAVLSYVVSLKDSRFSKTNRKE